MYAQERSAKKTVKSKTGKSIQEKIRVPYPESKCVTFADVKYVNDKDNEVEPSETLMTVSSEHYSE